MQQQIEHSDPPPVLEPNSQCRRCAMHQVQLLSPHVQWYCQPGNRTEQAGPSIRTDEAPPRSGAKQPPEEDAGGAAATTGAGAGTATAVTGKPAFTGTAYRQATSCYKTPSVPWELREKAT